MITPSGGLVLDPFAGTGSTAAAACACGVQSLLIEADENHVRDIGVRLGIDVVELIKTRVQSAAGRRLDQAELFGGTP